MPGQWTSAGRGWIYDVPFPAAPAELIAGHRIFAVEDEEDPLYEALTFRFNANADPNADQSWEGITPGFAPIDRIVYYGEPEPGDTGNGYSEDTSWAVRVNRVTGQQQGEQDYLLPFSDKYPSEREFDDDDVFRSETELVMHELMHVLGAGHPDQAATYNQEAATQGSALGALVFHSIMFPNGAVAISTGPSHRAAEVDAELFHRTGAQRGRVELPMGDSDFLRRVHGAGSFSVVYSHQWMPVWAAWSGQGYTTTPNYEMWAPGSYENAGAPFRWAPGIDETPCIWASGEEWAFPSGEVNRIATMLPRFTANYDTEVRVELRLIDSSQPPETSHEPHSVFGGYSVHVPGDGQWSDAPVPDNDIIMRGYIEENLSGARFQLAVDVPALGIVDMPLPIGLELGCE